jgi:crotonobetainyl-CoA:carnitine CoA-transferase CaiB-like acyl-CoA transferase
MQPLQGMTVLDLTRVVAGPFCSMILADMGARVIKIENPLDPDYTRTFDPMMKDGDKKFSGFFAQYNRNKEAVTLNLKYPEAKEMFKEMVKRADVVLENYRAGIMDKLGLGYTELSKINPKIIYAALSGFGQNGPYSEWPAYDNSGQALSGLWSINGLPGQPLRMGTIIGDMASTFFGAIGLLSAYIHVQHTGQGQLVDVAQLDSSLALTESAIAKYTIAGEIQGPLGNDHPLCRPYGMFKTKNGHVFFGGYTDKFWKTVCEYFNEPELLKDPEIDTMTKRFDLEVYNRRVLPKINEWFSKYTSEELQEGLAAKVPLTAIKNIPQVVADPQLNARNMFIDYNYGGKTYKLVGNPIHFSGTPCNTSGSAPQIGQDNKEVYKEFLNLDEAALTELKAKGVI